MEIAMKAFTKEYAGCYSNDKHRIVKVQQFNKTVWRKTHIKCGSTICETRTLKQAKQD